MTELGFVRPVVRRKLQAHERMRVYALRKNLFFLFVLLTLLGMLYGPGIVVYNTRSRNGDRSSPQNENSNAHSRIRGGSRAWISIDSQPFVSATKNHGRVFEGRHARMGGLFVSHSNSGIDIHPQNKGQVASRASHLIIVAGHSVTVSGHLEDAGEDESDWFLLDYQKGQGLPQAIKGHIQAGIDEANRDPDSLLVFSGGETRALTGPLTEGSSYFHVADAMKLWPPSGTVRARTVTEEFATDSFENL